MINRPSTEGVTPAMDDGDEGASSVSECGEVEDCTLLPGQKRRTTEELQLGISKKRKVNENEENEDDDENTEVPFGTADAQHLAHRARPLPPEQHERTLTRSHPHTEVGEHTTQILPGAHNFTVGHLIVQVPNAGHSASLKTVFESAHFLLATQMYTNEWKVLEPYVSHGAAHDSDERCDAPECAPETREAIQDEVLGLIRDGDVLDESKKMVWLGGPAGAGKTAIAGSVAESCKKSDLLAGSFFFSSFLGSVDRRSKRYVIITLAYQLARHKVLYEYKERLAAAIEGNPGIFQKRLSEQAECMILEPLQGIQGRSDVSIWPRGILYDGLDEVKAVQYHDMTREDLLRSDEDDQLEILTVLLALARSPAFPFRIFISSRPERIITEFFNETARAYTVSLFLDSKYDPDADIKRFLQSKFADIRRRSGISNSAWPGEAIDGIVDMSSGQFIVATTILRFVESGLPQRQLKEIMQVGQTRRWTKNPFALLDAIYAHIIERCPDPRLAVIWIRCITGEKVRIPPAHFSKELLEDMEGELNHLLTPLASLLRIPPASDQCSPITIYHKSLTDFLISPLRSGDLYVWDETWGAFYAERCLGVLQTLAPVVPYPCSEGRHDFLSELCSLLFRVSGPLGYEDPSRGLTFSAFLAHLDERGLEELAACDVAFWIRIILKESPAMLTALNSMSATLILGRIYRDIHLNVCARIRTGGKIRSGDCHAACVHWRRSILDEARALGWCVHELEAPSVQGPSLSAEQFEKKFKRPNEGMRCNNCHPPSNRKQRTNANILLPAEVTE